MLCIRNRSVCRILSKTRSDLMGDRLERENEKERLSPRYAPPGSGRQCEDIIVIKPPDCATEGNRKCAGTSGCHLSNMRRREVPVLESETCPTPTFLEFVDDPFTVTDCCEEQDMKSGSLDVNVGSQSPCSDLIGPVVWDKVYIPVRTRDCRPRVRDYRRRKSVM